MNLRAIGYFIALKIGEIAALLLVLCAAQWIGHFVIAALGESAHPIVETFFGVLNFGIIGYFCRFVYEAVKANWSWAKKLANKYKS